MKILSIYIYREREITINTFSVFSMFAHTITMLQVRTSPKQLASCHSAHTTSLLKNLHWLCVHMWIHHKLLTLQCLPLPCGPYHSLLYPLMSLLVVSFIQSHKPQPAEGFLLPETLPFLAWYCVLHATTLLPSNTV